MKKVLKLPVHAFVGDFVRGEPDEQLRAIYSLSQSELTRIVTTLKQRGTITDQDMFQRREQLRIRFGAEDGPPDPAREGKAAVDLNTGLVLHCPSCAAPVRREAKNCDYCKAPLDFSLKGKIVSCPNCFASTPADGRFCIRCSLQVTGLVEEGKILEDRLCPRCGIPLRGKKLGEFSLMGCDRCTGVFVPHETFEMMEEKRDATILAMSGQHRNEVQPDEKVVVRQVPGVPQSNQPREFCQNIGRAGGRLQGAWTLVRRGRNRKSHGLRFARGPAKGQGRRGRTNGSRGETYTTQGERHFRPCVLGGLCMVRSRS